MQLVQRSRPATLAGSGFRGRRPDGDAPKKPSFAGGRAHRHSTLGVTAVTGGAGRGSAWANQAHATGLRLCCRRAADRRDRYDMQVDGREVTVSGSLLQPPTRRTNDMLRVVLSVAFLAGVITSSLITRTRWDELEKSISRIVGVLTPTQSDVGYLVYGLAVLALPFMILIGLILARQWRLLIPYAAAALISVLALSITGTGLAAPRWHFDLSDRMRTVLAQVLDDPRWIAMLAAVLTVSGPWLPARWRHWWWTLLLAFVPIHLVVSAIVPARSLLGLAVGWFVGALVVLVVGTPALEVPLEAAVRALAKRGFDVSRLTVIRPAGRGPLVLSASGKTPECTAVVELYGPHQRSGGALRQLWGKLKLRDAETAPLVASMRRAVEYRGLMAIAIGDAGVANTETIAVAPLER